MDDEEAMKGWRRFDQKISRTLSSGEIEAFDFQFNDEDANQVVSAGYDARTFPREHALKDPLTRFLFKRQGRCVFDFKGKYGKLPEGVVTLKKSIKIENRPQLNCTLVCLVERSNLNERDINDDTVPVDQEERHFSKVCGRCVLRLLEFEFTGGALTGKRARVSKEDDERKRRRLGERYQTEEFASDSFLPDPEFTAQSATFRDVVSKTSRKRKSGA